MAGKNWQIEGKWVEYCNCDYGCPCETMAEPTYGHCTGLVAFKIDNGWCEDVRLDDLAVAATFYLPRALHHGQGIMQPMLDARVQLGAIRELHCVAQERARDRRARIAIPIRLRRRSTGQLDDLQCALDALAIVRRQARRSLLPNRLVSAPGNVRDKDQGLSFGAPIARRTAARISV